jgi:hypothetical protein
MEESLLRIQNWVNESKFSEAQKAAEALLIQNSAPTKELLFLYLQILLEQKKSLPPQIILDLSEMLIEQEVDESIQWLSLFPEMAVKTHHRQYKFLQIRIADKKGKVEDLNRLISDFQIFLFEKKNPAIPPILKVMTEKYFKNDFTLHLQQLSLSLMLYDFVACENTLKTLFLSTIERASSRGIKDKVQMIADVLDATTGKGYLEVYRGLCQVLIEGLQSKASLKKIAELLIYFEDFKFQSILLNILDQNDLKEIAFDYAVDVRSNPSYDFVYFEKYYRHLKSYFVQPRPKEVKAVPKLDVDLVLSDSPPIIPMFSALSVDNLEDELQFYNLFKYQDHSEKELFEIAISFLQADLPKVALKAVEKLILKDLQPTMKLQANYLRLTCQLQTGDFRAAVDTAIQGLDHSLTQDDILSFLYGQAEAYMRMNSLKEAKRILLEIFSINSDYRLTRERLKRLDEI